MKFLKVFGGVFLKIVEIYQMPGYFGNFQKTKAFGKFPRYPGILEIFWVFEGGIFSRFSKFLRYLGI